MQPGLGPARGRRHDDDVGRETRGVGLSASSDRRRAPAPTPRRRPSRRPPMTYGRPPRASISPVTRPIAASRAARSAVGSWWTVAPSAAISATPGPGVDRPAAPTARGGRPRPARAPAAAVSRQWFDQRRPVVTRVSAPSASAAPTRNSRLRSLLPPNASGSRSSRLIQISARPPSAAENRGSGWSGEGPSNSRKRGTLGRGQADMAGWYRLYHRPMATRISPADRHTTVGQHPGMERSIAISGPTVGADRLYSSIVSTAPGRPDADPSPRRLRDLDLHPVGRGSLHLGPDRAGGRADARGRRLHLHPGRRGPCRGERLVRRAAGRRPDPELPRFARRVPRRRPGRQRRRPGALLTDGRRLARSNPPGPADEHGLELSPEHAFPTDGWSGATFTGLVDPVGRHFVLKRTSLATDWIARATRDADLREGSRRPPDRGDGLAATHVDRLPRRRGRRRRRGDPHARPVGRAHRLGTAGSRPGDRRSDAAPGDRGGRPAARDALEPRPRVGDRARGRAAPPWCPLAERLLLLARPSAAAYAPTPATPWASGSSRAGTPSTGERRRRRASWSTPWARIPRPSWPPSGSCRPSGCTATSSSPTSRCCPRTGSAFIDWQMTLRAPVAVELGWFLVSNSGSLPGRPDSILAEYRQALEWDSGRWGFGGDANDFAGLTGDWEAQLDLTWIVGLLLRGWRKGLDAEAGVVLAVAVVRGRRPRLVVRTRRRGGRAATLTRRWPCAAARCGTLRPKEVPHAQDRSPAARHPAERLSVLAGRRGQRVRVPGRPGRRRARGSRRRPGRHRGRDARDARQRRSPAGRGRPRLRGRREGARSTCATSASSRR